MSNCRSKVASAIFFFNHVRFYAVKKLILCITGGKGINQEISLFKSVKIAQISRSFSLRYTNFKKKNDYLKYVNIKLSSINGNTFDYLFKCKSCSVNI